MKHKSRDRGGKPAVSILEEATHLLRANPVLLAPYYFGSLPFVLGLLYFWTDMSTGADAWKRCPEASWGLTLLFIWMKTWQSLYARRLFERIRGESSPGWGLGRMARAAAIQAALQPWGIVILPVAFIVMLPFPQAFAFFQNVSLMGSGDEGNLRAVVRRAWRQASLWPMQNTLILWLTSPFLLVLAAFFLFVILPVSSSLNPEASVPLLMILGALVVVPLCPLGMITALNVGIALVLLPWLLKILFGVETVFSIGGVHSMTFYAVVCGLSYLCLDPLMKASYCLRCFYGESLQTGEDLKVELGSCARPGSMAAVVIAVFLVFGSCGKAFAQPGPTAVSGAGASVSAGQLDSAIESVMRNPEYSWRMPREKTPHVVHSHTAFRDFLDSIMRAHEAGWGYVKKGWVKAWDFIRDILSRLIPSLPHLEKPDSRWTPFSRAFIIIPLACIAAVLAFLAWRAWKQRRPERVTAGVSVKIVPDITREDVDATALPEEDWLHLAEELMGKGELRLALRAVYLATLACLARQELITIAKYKSDREYELELRRRSHTQPQLAGVFAENRAVFEGAWYGLHEVTPGIMDRFLRNQERIKSHAQG